MRRRLRRAALVAMATLIAIAIGLVATELVAIAVLTVRDGEFISARTRFERRTNTFVTDLIGTRSECRYIDTLYPHPYLGFVHHGNPPCGFTVNNIGLFGPDFPLVRRTDRYTVLVTGGSVASQFAQPFGGQGPYLERLLNERYQSPTGKPFLVLDGGDGAWKQPQQLILFAMYVDVVDAVVTLDGFNEANYVGSPHRFEYPAANFQSANPLATQAFPELLARYAVGRAEGLIVANPVLSRSQAAFGLISSLDAMLQRRAASKPHPTTSIESIFALPTEWSGADRTEWGIRQYEKYIREMNAIGRDHGVRVAHFIQPVPALGKPLTDDERKGAGGINEYADKYRWMSDRLLALRGQGIEVFSLIDVFEGHAERLYADDIHLIRNPDGSSPGYRMMSERMAQNVGSAWKLKPRRQ